MAVVRSRRTRGSVPSRQPVCGARLVSARCRLPARHAGAALLTLVVCLLGSVTPAAAQVDTTVAAVTRPAHTPRGALWRAAALPGWGQWYNRQYTKIPVVYLGLGGLGALALYTNTRYLLYRHAYLFTARTAPDGTPVFPEYADDYARLLNDLGLPPESELPDDEIQSRRSRLQSGIRAQRDNFRRNRDLLYVGVGLWYGLSLLDAFVSAHLLDFDVSEDLSVTVTPQLTPAGPAAALRVCY